MSDADIELIRRKAVEDWKAEHIFRKCADCQGWHPTGKPCGSYRWDKKRRRFVALGGSVAR